MPVILMPVITPRPTGHNAQRWPGIIGAGVMKIKGLRAYIQVYIAQDIPSIALRTTSSQSCSIFSSEKGHFLALYWGEKALHRGKFRSPRAVLVALALQRERWGGAAPCALVS